jgi:peptidoglycan pentaglycine glycine transferase (the first glycine)
MSQKIEKFVEENQYGEVHQLPVWGEIQTHLKGRDKFWMLTDEESGQITASALVIKQSLPFGLCWLYCPRGPLHLKGQPLRLFQKIKKIAKEEKAVFFRFDPGLEKEKMSKDYQQFLKLLKTKKAHAYYQPESTLIVDLEPPDKEILKQMKPKGRYNIKVAGKHGVTVRQGTSKEDIQTFYSLFTQTTQRDKFSGHPHSYYQKFIEALGPKKAKIYIAEYEPKDDTVTQTPTSKKPLAAAIVTYFKDTATYYYGASSNEYRSTMAPYLLHWKIMQDAKAAGYKKYDLFGISPNMRCWPTSVVGQQPHPWASVTEFKLKFGGKRVDYIPAQEIVYKPFWYLAIKIAKHRKKNTRGA